MATTVVISQNGLGQQPQIVNTAPIQNVQTSHLSTAHAQTARRFNGRAGLVTGILQLLVATIVFLSAIATLALGTDYNVAWGIWAGIGFYGVSGVLGVISNHQPTNTGVIIAYMVMSILSAIVAACHMIYDATASANNGNYACQYIFIYDYELVCNQTNALKIVHAIASVTATFEIIVAIVASCYGCSGTCCNCGYTQSGVNRVVVQTAVHQQQPNPVGPPQFLNPSIHAPPSPNYNHGYSTSYAAPPPPYDAMASQAARPPPTNKSDYGPPQTYSQQPLPQYGRPRPTNNPNYGPPQTYSQQPPQYESHPASASSGGHAYEQVI